MHYAARQENGPRRLAYLTSAFKTFKGYKEGDFPPNLHSLHIPWNLISARVQLKSIFPPLVTFHCHQPISPKYVSKIPRSVIDLTLSLEDITDAPLDFPPNLSTLFVTGRALGSFGILTNGKLKVVRPSTLPKPGTANVVQTLPLKSIPRTVTSLSIFGIPIPLSDLIYLPRQLTYLSIQQTVHDQRYNPTTEAALDKAKEVCQEHSNASSSSVLWNGNPQVSMVDWLPRSLTHLTLVGDYDIPIASWSRLPPHLVSLVLNSHQTISQDILHHLPMHHLSKLVLNLDRLDDEHFALILATPLEKFVVPRTTMIALTEKYMGSPKLLHFYLLLPNPLCQLHEARMLAFHEAAELEQFDNLIPALSGALP